MYRYTSNIRVRYAETDKMGVVYHSNYIEYFEVARTECMRSLGFSYREMEAGGIILPVTKVEAKYHGSLKYDDEAIVTAVINQLPSYKIRFDYAIHFDQSLITDGYTELVFFDLTRQRPCRAPRLLLDKLQPYFN